MFDWIVDKKYERKDLRLGLLEGVLASTNILPIALHLGFHEDTAFLNTQMIAVIHRSLLMVASRAMDKMRFSRSRIGANRRHGIDKVLGGVCGYLGELSPFWSCATGSSPFGHKIFLRRFNVKS
eukprot:COSAG02_NODE_196_length_29603_cov_181.420790_3_plen_124_part_00